MREPINPARAASVRVECGKCLDGWTLDDETNVAAKCRACSPTRDEAILINRAGLPARPELANLGNFDTRSWGVDSGRASGPRSTTCRHRQQALAMVRDVAHALVVHPEPVRDPRWAQDAGLYDLAHALGLNSLVSHVSITCPSFLLAGPPGTGKTHLLVGAARAVAGRESGRDALRQLRLGHLVRPRSREAPRPLLYVHFGELVSDLRRRMQENESTQFWLDRASSAGLLLLDELAAGRGTDWERSIATEIVCRRHDAGLPTWATTNYTLDVSPKQGDMTALANRMDPQAMSRVREGYKTAVLPVGDMRRRGRDA